jgi:hypothetical protein
MNPGSSSVKKAERGITVHDGVAPHTHNFGSRLNLQVWWPRLKEVEPLHVPKMVELCLKVIPNFVRIDFLCSSLKWGMPELDSRVGMSSLMTTSSS